MATTGALVLSSSVMLSWVALLNHAPLVFSDSLGYATWALRGEVPGFFSMGFIGAYILIAIVRAFSGGLQQRT
jgi:hypothetical protein